MRELSQVVRKIKELILASLSSERLPSGESLSAYFFSGMAEIRARNALFTCSE
jgi:hypothetical protein